MSGPDFLPDLSPKTWTISGSNSSALRFYTRVASPSLEDTSGEPDFGNTRIY